MALTAPKSSRPAGRISTVVPSAKSAYTWPDPTPACAVLTAVVLIFPTTVFLLASAGEDDLERAVVGGVGEHVVRLFKVIQAEVMGDQPLGVNLAAGDQAHQGRGGGGVLQARGDRYVPDPLFVQVQRDGPAVHADVRDPATRPDQLDRHLEGSREPDGFDGHVRAEPPGQVPGQVPDDLQRVVAGVVHDHVGAEVLGRIQPGIGQVDGDNVARAEQLRAGDRGQANRPGPDDGDEIARAHAAGQDADLVASWQNVGQHEDFLVGRAVGNPERGCVGERHANILGLGAVNRVAEDPAAAGQALPVAGLTAVLACPARADAGDQYTVAGRERTDAIADLVDGPDRLVAQDPAVAHLRQVALENVQVGTADRGRIDLHDNVAVIGDNRVGYLVPGLAPGTVVYECSHGCLHVLVKFCSQASSRTHPRGRAEGPFLAGLKVMGPGA